MKTLGSFLLALNALLQLRVPILDLGYRYSPVKTHSKKCYRCERGTGTQNWVSVLGYGYRYSDTLPVRKNLTGILKMVLHKIGAPTAPKHPQRSPTATNTFGTIKQTSKHQEKTNASLYNINMIKNCLSA
ncbi:hypothetical protein GQ457_01G028110 [Hibiscus cannabinus]